MRFGFVRRIKYFIFIFIYATVAVTVLGTGPDRVVGLHALGGMHESRGYALLVGF